MLTRVFACAILAASVVPATALAEHNGSNPGKSTTMNSSQNSGNPTAMNENTNQTAQQLPQEIKNQLQQDGFSEVKVIPGSFIVSAKDKNGHDVNMVIGPHSMMMLTEIPGGSSATTGSGPSNGSSNQ